MNQVNLLEPLPYEAPEETPADAIEVVDEQTITNTNDKIPNSNTDSGVNDKPNTDETGQGSLF